MSRRRYRYDLEKKCLVELGEDWTDAPRTAAPVTDLYMDGTRATDGTDIGSRAKRRNYMQANGLADADDFRQTWAKAEAERALGAASPAQKRERTEALREAVHKLQARRR